jgi:hypothetical protein
MIEKGVRSCGNCKYFEWGYEDPHSNECDCLRDTRMANLKGFPFTVAVKCFEKKDNNNR